MSKQRYAHANLNQVSLAFYMPGGLGDDIIGKKLIETILSCADAPVGVDLYCPDQETRRKYLEALFQEPCYHIISSRPEYEREKRYYDGAIIMEYLLDMEVFQEERMREKAPGLAEKMKAFSVAVRSYGLSWHHPPEQSIHFARMKYRGKNCYTSQGREILPIEDWHVNIPLSLDGKRKFQELDLKLPYITLNYGWGTLRPGRVPNKVWPLERFGQLAQLLKKEYPGLRVFQVGGEHTPKMEHVDGHIFGESLETLKYILKASALHIDCEGGLVHLASQLGTKCAVLFGPTPISYFGYEENINISAGDCQGCYYIYDDFTLCGKGEDRSPCMAGISAEMVRERIAGYLELVMGRKEETENKASYSPLVSVIVPALNVEKYLPECIESLLNQSMQNFEILLHLSSKSKDHTEEIGKKYAERSGKIRYFIREEKGLGDARNYAFQHARGKYITFVDSDDYVAEDFLECLSNALEHSNSEIACCGFDKVYSDGSIEDMWIPQKSGSFKTNLFSYFGSVHYGITVNKMYRRKWLLERNVQQVSNVLHEDDSFHLMLAAQVCQVEFVKKVLYHYRQDNASSITHGGKVDYEYFKSMDFGLDYLRKHNLLQSNAFLISNFMQDRQWDLELHSRSPEAVRAEAYPVYRRYFPMVEALQEAEARALSHPEDLGWNVILFGTGASGRQWLQRLGRDRVRFFVEEDPAYIGSRIEGVPVISFSKFCRVHSTGDVLLLSEDRSRWSWASKLAEAGYEEFLQPEIYEFWMRIKGTGRRVFLFSEEDGTVSSEAEFFRKNLPEWKVVSLGSLSNRKLQCCLREFLRSDDMVALALENMDSMEGEQLLRRVIRDCPENLIVVFHHRLSFEKNAWGEAERERSRKSYGEAKNLLIFSEDRRSHELVRSLGGEATDGRWVPREEGMSTSAWEKKLSEAIYEHLIPCRIFPVEGKEWTPAVVPMHSRVYLYGDEEEELFLRCLGSRYWKLVGWSAPGYETLGYPVMPPRHLLASTFDYVLVNSRDSSFDENCRWLLGQGIPEYRILRVLPDYADGTYIPERIALSLVLIAENDLLDLSLTIDSICGQTLKNLELLVLVRKNLDGVEEYLSALREEDDRIRLLTVEDGDPIPWEMILDEVHGDYVAFVEAGAILSKNWLKEIYAGAISLDRPDLVKGGWENRFLTLDGEKREVHEGLPEERHDLYEQEVSPSRVMIPLRKEYSLLWNGIYHRQFLKKMQKKGWLVSKLSYEWNGILLHILAHRQAYLRIGSYVHCECGKNAGCPNNLRYYLICIMDLLDAHPLQKEAWGVEILSLVFEDFVNRVGEDAQENMEGIYRTLHERMVAFCEGEDSVWMDRMLSSRIPALCLISWQRFQRYANTWKEEVLPSAYSEEQRV